MPRNRQRGSILVITTAITLLVAFIGVGLFFLMRMFAGEKELLNATESGVLNVAKTEVQQPAVVLADGTEKNNFLSLADNDGAISLINYNRVIAQTLLVGLNAQAEQSAQATANAQTLKNSVQSGGDNLSARLSNALSAESGSLTNFLSVALGNSVRMLNNTGRVAFESSRYQLSYVEPGDAANVYLDASILPAGASLPGAALTSRVGSAGFPYLAGYRDMAVGDVFSLQAAVVPPEQQPHLISDRTFDSHLNSPISGGSVPPNAFRCVATLQEMVSNRQGGAGSCAIVGALSRAFEARIPGGFLTVSYSPGNGNAGTIAALLSQVRPEAAAEIIPQLRQRMREIQPRESDEALNALLNSTAISPGETVYIYSNGNGMVASSAPPPRLVSGSASDGNSKTYSRSDSSTSNSSSAAVNGHITTTTTTTRTTTNMMLATYTPSSGFNNLLGVLALDTQQSISESVETSSVDENYSSGTSTDGEGGGGAGACGGSDAGTGSSNCGGSSSGDGTD